MAQDPNLGLQTQGNVKIKSLGRGADENALRALVAQVNTPATPDDVERMAKQVPAEAKKEIEKAFQDASKSAPSLASPSPATPAPGAESSAILESAAPVSHNQMPAKLFITGRESAILQLLSGLPDSSVLVSLNKTASETLKATGMLKGEPPANLVSAFRQFGDGTSQPTLERLLLLGLIRRTYENFGTQGFWAKLVIEQTRLFNPAKQCILVGVQTSVEFKALQEAGFTHYHAWSNSMPAPGDSTSGLITALDNDVSKKISAQRTGPPRLRVIWMDDRTKCPALDRMFTPEDFRNEVVSIAPELVESPIVI